MKQRRRYPQNMTIDGRKMTVTQWKREMRALGYTAAEVQYELDDAWFNSRESDAYNDLPLEVALEAKLQTSRDYGYRDAYAKEISVDFGAVRNCATPYIDKDGNECIDVPFTWFDE